MFVDNLTGPGQDPVDPRLVVFGDPLVCIGSGSKLLDEPSKVLFRSSETLREEEANTHTHENQLWEGRRPWGGLEVLQSLEEKQEVPGTPTDNDVNSFLVRQKFPTNGLGQIAAPTHLPKAEPTEKGQADPRSASLEPASGLVVPDVSLLGLLSVSNLRVPGTAPGPPLAAADEAIPAGREKQVKDTDLRTLSYENKVIHFAWLAVRVAGETR